MAPPLITTLAAASTRCFGQGGGGGFKMPAGIIIPFTGASTPSGWDSFSSANGKGIIGAGSTYAAGDTGGSSTISEGVLTSNTGAHTGPSVSNFVGGTPGIYPHSGNNSAGAHSHTVTLSGTGDPQYRQYKLIKAAADANAIPAGGIILGESTISGDGVINYDSGNDGLMYGGANVANGGSNSLSLTGTVSNSGSHSHFSNSGSHRDNETLYFRPGSAGGHTHSASSSTLTWNVKRYILTAWQRAEADFKFEGAGIAMWESATPPEGWFICNGSNSTPDLRDYFIQIGSTGTHGTTAGDNVNPYSTPSSISDNITHSHPGVTPYEQQVNGDSKGYHNSTGWSHTHNISSGSITQLPPFYGLYFIQKAVA